MLIAQAGQSTGWRKALPELLSFLGIEPMVMPGG